jgi:PAS domain S-box-containing protein
MNLPSGGLPDEPLQAKLEDLLEALPDAILLVDRAGRILYANSRAAQLFGYATGKLLAATIDILVPDRHHALAREHRDRFFDRARSSPLPVRLELHARRKDSSEFPVEMSLAPLEARAGTVVASTIRDITERRLVEETLNEKNAELEAVNRELEAFDYSIAHDLRAPLHRIEGFAAMLGQDHGEKLDPAGREVLQRIVDAGKSMDQLVTDILALATATRGRLARSEVDVTALAREVDATFRRGGPEREVEFGVQPGMRTRADAGLLRVVVQNLLGNAWKFTRDRAGARIEMGCEIAGGQHVFFVRDNGTGFDPAGAEDIFKPFRRMHGGSRFEGTGIGLATVQRIVQRHGGRVWAEGAVGSGATFFFTLARPPSA